VEDFIHAAAKVRAVDRGLRFIVAGGGRGDAYEASCRQLAIDLGLGETIRWLGSIDGAEGVLDELGIFVLPSSLEGHPLVLLEAMARGKPVIATDIPGIEESLTDGREGFLVPVASPEQIAERILLLTQDPDRAREMGDAARARASRDFSLERFLQETIPLVLGGEGPHAGQ
jgi:glycosyltransferase involved in cell wall biosynthesis